MLGTSRVLYLSVYAYSQPHLVIFKTRPKPYASTLGNSLSPRRVRASSFLLLHHHNHPPVESHPFPPLAGPNNVLFDPFEFWWPLQFCVIALVRRFLCLVTFSQTQHDIYIHSLIALPACLWFEMKLKTLLQWGSMVFLLSHSLAPNDLKSNLDLLPPDR